jgi:hypothetical protein
MRRTTAILAVAVGALAAPPIAIADKSSTFEGSCRFAGVVLQSPPLTNTPQPGRALATGRGGCSGTVTGANGERRILRSERALWFARAAGTVSCGGGSATGSGYIRFGRQRLRFRFSEVRGPGAGAIRLEGVGGGSAAGTATVSPEEDPVAIALACSGDGLRRVRVDIDVSTTPAMTG